MIVTSIISNMQITAEIEANESQQKEAFGSFIQICSDLLTPESVFRGFLNVYPFAPPPLCLMERVLEVWAVQFKSQSVPSCHICGDVRLDLPTV